MWKKGLLKPPLSPPTVAPWGAPLPSHLAKEIQGREPEATRQNSAPRPRFQIDPGRELKGGMRGMRDRNTPLTLLSL